MNDTGIRPVEYKCVIRLDPVEEKIGSIIIPDEQRSRNQMATTTGVLLEAGGNAFEDWSGVVPKAGDRVMVNKYAGQFKESDPESLERVINDREILAVLND